jgi:peptidoglycan/xylan/chitin deacetylase (PgdA/CDA1 family)
MKSLILTYHKLYDQNDYNFENYTINVNTFQRHVEYINSLTLRSLTVENISETKDENSIIITFDDGNISDYEIAFPLLSKYALNGTFFLIANRVGKLNYLSWKNVREMHDYGMSIQSHGLDHRIMADLSEKELRDELLMSKNIIEDNISAPVDFFSVPGGFDSYRVFKMAEKIGYKGACTSFPGYNRNYDIVQRFKIMKRFMITRKTSFEHFKEMVNFGTRLEFNYKCMHLFKRIMMKVIGRRRYQMLWERFCKSV